MKEKEIISTKFGRARRYDGYYRIISRKEGNHGKYLHRLIYEEHFGEIPEGYHVHHVDGNSLNNDIGNLVAIEKGLHSSLHNKGENHPNFGNNTPEETKKKISKTNTGKKRSKETIRKLSEAHNTTGYFRVCKVKNKNCKQGFIWRYRYPENGKDKMIERVNLNDLEKEVKARGFEWEMIDEEKAMKTIKELNNEI